MPIVTRVFSVRHLSEAKGGSADEPRRFEDNGDSRRRERNIPQSLPVVFDLCLDEHVYTDELLLLLLALRARRVSKLHFTRRYVSLAPTRGAHLRKLPVVLGYHGVQHDKHCINVF